MMFRISGILTAVFLLFVGGCASTTDLDNIKADINQLKKDSFDIKKDSSSMQTEIAELKQTLSRTASEESFNAIRESQLSLYSQMSDFTKEIQLLKGRFEESKYFMDKTLKDASVEKELLRSQISNIETQLKELNEKIAKISGIKNLQQEQTPDTGMKGSENADQKKSDDETPAKAYEAAYNLFKEKQYKAARENFTLFLKKFPKDNLATNAQFWIGEAYYAEKDFEGAILAYEACIKTYPNSEKVPAALLKQGISFIEIGDKKTAKVIFEKIIEKYPDSKEAGLAKKEISGLTGKQQKTHKKK